MTASVSDTRRRSVNWYRRPDSNRQGLRREHLELACLPNSITSALHEIAAGVRSMCAFRHVQPHVERLRDAPDEAYRTSNFD